ncbi:putative histone H2B.1-like [Capsicum annuum]|nr:putative histone H2B.1-like [Capsicum annuum]
MLFAPSTIATIVGILIGVSSLLRKLMIGNEAPLHVIDSSASMLGEATIPAMTLIIGANLLKGLKKSGVGMWVVIGIQVIRYVALPLSGICVVKAARHFGLVGSDSLYQFVLLLQYALPSAMTIGTITQLFEVGECECSVIMLWNYALASVALTLWTTYYILSQMLCDKVACDWPKTCHLRHLAMFYLLLNLTWIATSFDECGLASLVFNLTGMPDKWSIKEEIDVLIFNKFINITAFVLHSSTHDKESAATYPKGSNKGRATWNYSQSGFGEFHYVTCYWEWVEDVLSHSKEALERTKIYDIVFASLFTYDINENVLQAFCELWHSSTNTICVGIGELSISLWGMHMIGGLPVQGTFFDEVIPSVKELSQTDQQWKPFLPKTCAYLFSAFYRLSNEENVPFVKLGVEGSLREETNLVAFLTCWICKFVLPIKKLDHIRPSIFKIASLMAHGERFALAIPVLASIYRVLIEITTSTNLSASDIIFPIQYVYGWIGKSSTSSLVKSKTSPLSPKSSPSRDNLVRTGEGSSRPLLKLNDTPSVASNKTRKRNNDSSLLEINSGKMPTKTPLEYKIPPICIVNEVVDANGDTNSMEEDQDQHLKRKRKKAKDQSSEFVDLDIATINSEAFFINDPSSIMPLPELTEQENTKERVRMEDLQSNLAKFDKELKLLSIKREKTISCIKEQKQRLSKSLEKLITFEGELHAIREKHPLSEDEVETLSKLKEAVEASRQQILEFRPFP